jgi:hypothetical protein
MTTKSIITLISTSLSLLDKNEITSAKFHLERLKYLIAADGANVAFNRIFESIKTINTGDVSHIEYPKYGIYEIIELLGEYEKFESMIKRLKSAINYLDILNLELESNLRNAMDFITLARQEFWRLK